MQLHKPFYFNVRCTGS